MGMSQTLSVRQCLICNVCQRTWKWPNLKDDLQASPLNTGEAIFLLLVSSGCCPACGQQLCGGQTPDHVLKRYCKLLKGELSAERYR